MKRQFVIVGFLLTVAILAFLAFLSIGSPLSDLTKVKFVISGTPGVAFTGHCSGTNRAGGLVARDLVGMVPTNFVVDARQLNFTLQQQKDNGWLVVAVRRSFTEASVRSAHGVQGNIDTKGVTAGKF